MNKILLAGESWMSFTTHVKGFDTFYTSIYESGEKWLKAALEKSGFQVDFLPNHLAMDNFPFTMEELKQYSGVILSDIGANTLLLPSETFVQSVKKPNRTKLIKDYVLDGGGLLMIGGYMTFAGIDGKGKWHDTPVQDILPVQILPVDDRMEHCEGIKPVMCIEHEALKGMPDEFPEVLGYNRTIPKKEAIVAATVENNPFIAFGEYGKGRSAVCTTDCAPHWAPQKFCEWEYYDAMWQGIVNWIANIGEKQE